MYNVVEKVSINVKPGEVHALLGPNASGKSTVLRTAAGLLPPSRGDVLIEGISIYKKPEVKRKLGYVPEGEALFKTLTVRSLLKFMSQLYGIAFSSHNFELLETLDIVDILDKRVGSLSMGQKRKVMLSLALLHEPDILIIDEPTANLDLVVARELRNYIRKLASSEGRAILLASHNVAEVEELASHAEVMVDGRIVLHGLVRDIVKCLPAVTKVGIKCTKDPSSYLEHLGYRCTHSRGYIEITVGDPETEIPRILRYLESKGISVSHLSRKGNPLEEVLVQAYKGRR